MLNYKARHPLYPHESTGDQFFSEEQFETYRDRVPCGLMDFFGGRDDFAKFRSGCISLDAGGSRMAGQGVSIVPLQGGSTTPRYPSFVSRVRQSTTPGG